MKATTGAMIAAGIALVLAPAAFWAAQQPPQQSKAAAAQAAAQLELLVNDGAPVNEANTST